jgi:hypothetical protein
VRLQIKTILAIPLTVLNVLVLLLVPVTAHAFSSIGAGTSSNPYRISTCGQMQEIDGNLGAYYVVARDIDCTGFSFDHLAHSSPFTGTLDGRNHTISNIDIDSYGLFYETSGATIKNLRLDGGSVGAGSSGSFWGSFGGFADNGTTLENIHSNLTIDATGDTTNGGGIYIGGLFGQLKNGSTLTRSSYTGTLSANVYAGGLIGLTYGTNAVSITDSYVGGTINLVTTTVSSTSHYPTYVGGVLGASTVTTHISRVYSAANMHVADQSVYVGGIYGLGTNTTLDDSFAANTVTDTGGIFVGGVAGVDGTITNTYFDAALADGLDCSGTAGAICTAVNGGGANPNYFKSTTSNDPLNEWNFTDTWKTTTDYPALRALDRFAGIGVPNGGDANGDSDSDRSQTNVASVANSDGVWSTVEIPASATCMVDDPEAVNARSIKIDSGYGSSLTTMTGFKVYCSAPGASVPVTIIYDKQYDTAGAVLRQYNPTTNSYSTVAGAVFGVRTIGGIVKSTVTYTITDGGTYDTDGTTDGVITDPVGFAQATSVIGSASFSASGSARVTAPNTGLAPKSNTSAIGMLLGGSVAIMAGARVVRRDTQS